MAPPATPTGDWSPETFARNGERLLEALQAHFESIRQRPVATSVDASALRSALEAEPPEAGEDFERVLQHTLDDIVPNLLHWNHPSFYGFFPTSASFAGVLAETFTAAMNVNAMLWRTSPAASALEAVVLRWLAGMAGYPRDADAILLNGASLATLYTLVAARDAAYGPVVRTAGMAGRDLPAPRVYASEEAHSSVEKAALTLGFGLDNVVRIPTDEYYQMRPEALEAVIRTDLVAGRQPVAVVATVGTTSLGSVDPLGPISQVCSAHRVWLHVDAAYAGFYRLVPSLRHEVEDLSVGDSLVVNPQKTIFVPLEATALFCRRRGALAATFQVVPPYLSSEPEPGTLDYMSLSPQLGRSFRALKVWWVIRTFGREGLASRLEQFVGLANWLRAQASAHPDWRVVGGSRFPLVCLRYLPRELVEAGAAADDLDGLNAAIVAAVNNDGRAYVSHSLVREGYIIRVSVGNIHTTGEDVARLWAILTELAARQLAAHRASVEAS
jgi:aromatic-L-amino-acid/L-tryptophan decarboxylase